MEVLLVYELTCPMNSEIKSSIGIVLIMPIPGF